MTTEVTVKSGTFSSRALRLEPRQMRKVKLRKLWRRLSFPTAQDPAVPTEATTQIPATIRELGQTGRRQRSQPRRPMQDPKRMRILRLLGSLLKVKGDTCWGRASRAHFSTCQRAATTAPSASSATYAL